MLGFAHIFPGIAILALILFFAIAVIYSLEMLPGVRRRRHLVAPAFAVGGFLMCVSAESQASASFGFLLLLPDTLVTVAEMATRDLQVRRFASR
ncbi:MAG: hypothetical protein Kow0099_21700 [Candidatus Abyssubacteria bacterium]